MKGSALQLLLAAGAMSTKTVLGGGIQLRVEDLGQGPKMPVKGVISNGRRKREAAKARNAGK